MANNILRPKQTACNRLYPAGYAAVSYFVNMAVSISSSLIDSFSISRVSSMLYYASSNSSLVVFLSKVRYLSIIASSVSSLVAKLSSVIIVLLSLSSSSSSSLSLSSIRSLGLSVGSYLTSLLSLAMIKSFRFLVPCVSLWSGTIHTFIPLAFSGAVSSGSSIVLSLVYGCSLVASSVLSVFNKLLAVYKLSSTVSVSSSAHFKLLRIVLLVTDIASSLIVSFKALRCRLMLFILSSVSSVSYFCSCIKQVSCYTVSRLASSFIASGIFRFVTDIGADVVSRISCFRKRSLSFSPFTVLNVFVAFFAWRERFVFVSRIATKMFQNSFVFVRNEYRSLIRTIASVVSRVGRSYGEDV